jgi:hypothetical protein
LLLIYTCIHSGISNRTKLIFENALRQVEEARKLRESIEASEHQLHLAKLANIKTLDTALVDLKKSIASLRFLAVDLILQNGDPLASKITELQDTACVLSHEFAAQQLKAIISEHGSDRRSFVRLEKLLDTFE